MIIYIVRKITAVITGYIDRIKMSGKKLPQYIAALSVCFGATAFGTVLGWTANVNTELTNGDLNNLKIDDYAMGWISSIATLGSMLMCFPIGLICDLLGRKLTNLLLILPFLLGWLLIIFSNSIGMIYAGRLLTGMAGGALCVSAPMYTTEVAQKEIRGMLGSFYELFLTIGILLSYTLANFVAPLEYTIICACLPLLFGIMFVFQPETPVFLMKQGKREAAKKSLVRLRGQKYDVENELKEIISFLEEDSAQQITIWESLKKRKTQRATLIVFGLMFFQQMSGVNAVVFYTEEIFSSASVDIDPKIATIIVGSMLVLGVLLSLYIVDNFGRKILLTISGLLMGISIVVLGIFFSLKEHHLVSKRTLSDIGFVPIVALCVFMTISEIGFGPIPWVISTEVFPVEIKTFGSAAAGSFNWFLAFLVTRFYLDIKVAWGGDVVFYIFGVISLLGTVFVIFLVPETKGKTFDEIQNEL